MTVTESPAVAGAVETTTKLASHLHPPASFDLDDHPMPTGREEVWRFTPLKRLGRGGGRRTETGSLAPNAAGGLRRAAAATGGPGG